MDSTDRHRTSGATQPGPLFRAASHLARRRRYTEARATLDRARSAGQCSLPDYLDLQARVFAQQGMFVEADACWREAMRVDPTRASFVEALSRLRRPTPRHGRVVATAAAAALLVVLLLALGALLRITSDSSSWNREELTALSLEASQLARAVAGLERALTELDTKLRDAAMERTAMDRQLDAVATRVAESPTETTSLRRHEEAMGAARGVADESVQQRDALFREAEQRLTEGLAAVREHASNEVDRSTAELGRALRADFMESESALESRLAGFDVLLEDLRTSVTSLSARSLEAPVQVAQLIDERLGSLATVQGAQALDSKLNDVVSELALLSAEILALKRALDADDEAIEGR